MVIRTVNIRKANMPDVKKNTHYFYCGRGSELGNPYVIGFDGTREEVIRKYKGYFYSQELYETNLYKQIKEAVEKDKIVTLGCYCKPRDCHCDVIEESLRKGL